ncbi:hypothetical protein FRC08_004995 [Ceratobasidium sp. 394]|nr:hypothetical protein FRC08_004995 [Ceratobasidium sp. 394]
MYQLVATKKAMEENFLNWVHLGTEGATVLSLGDSMESLSLMDNPPSVSAEKGESESEDWGAWEEEKMKELEEALSDSLSLPTLIPEDQL